MTATHRIDELLFDLAFDSPSMGMARTDELRRLVMDKLLPLMETVFDQFGSDDMVWQIDKLVVDVGDVTEAELPAALVAGLRRALGQALHGEDQLMDAPAPLAGGDAPVNRVGSSRRRGDVDVLLAFLADGTMPWQLDATAPASHETLLARILARNADAFVQAVAASPHRAVMLARLARQFGPAQLEELLRKTAPGHADADLSQLEALQELLQDAALTRTVWSGALHAAWEAVLTASLDRRRGSPQSSAQRLTRRALNWLAEQQREELAAVAERLLVARASRHDDATASDIVHAVRRISEAALPAEAVEDSAFSIAEVGIGDMPGEAAEQAVVVPRGPRGPFMPIAGLSHAEDDVPEAWRALVAHPGDGALLARLVRQSSPATLQAMMRHFTPDHAKPLLVQLDALQCLLAGLSVSAQLSQRALSAAWVHILGAVLARPAQLPAILPMLDEVIAVLAAEQTIATPTESTAAIPGAQQRALVVSQLRAAAAAASGDPAGLATALMVMEGMPGRQEAAPSFAAMPSSVTDAAQDAEPHTPTHTPQKLHELPPAMAPIRSRVTSALMGGKAGDIYDDWRGFQDSQPDLLRSAVLHYGGYAEIRDKMASIFPLSLLRDMEALLSPEAAALTARIWDDERLRSRLSTEGAAQWSHWRRGWWRGALAYLLSLAREQDDRAGSSAPASFNSTAYVNAALEGAGMTVADDDLHGYVMALAQGRASPLRPELTPEAAAQVENGQQRKTPPVVSQVPALTALFEAIRSGAEPLQTLAFSADQLEQWIREAVREPSFYQAIADHAAVARDRRAYYVQVLQALAQNRIVDLEEFAAAEELALPVQVDQAVALATLADAAGQTTPVDPYQTDTASTAPGNVGITEERDKAQLVSRLAKALMKGDPALLYGDWDILLHKHALLLGEALRHYGIRDDILQRIVLSFPESMLYDMAVLLAPAAMPAWRQLRDQASWAAALETVSASDPTPFSLDENTSSAPADDFVSASPALFASWRRQLWKAALQQRLRTDYREEERGDSEGIAGDSPLVKQASGTDIDSIRALASSLSENAELFRWPWQRRLLDSWVDLSVRSELSRQDSAREPSAMDARTDRDHVEDDIRAILDHHHRLSETEKPAVTVRAELLQRFARLRIDPALIDMSWPVADLERLVEACIFAHGADAAAHRQRQTFLLAIRTQAPSESAPERGRYFNAVLQALLQEQTLDLEEIAEASKGNHESITANKAGDDQTGGQEEHGGLARQAPAAPASDPPASDSLAHADFMLSPGFREGVVLPAGLAEWLKRAIDTAAPEIVPMLVTLSRNPEAVARLLEVIPASSWQKLAALAPYSPLQMQRMRRYAGDVADMFAEQNRQLSAKELAQFEWRFLLPYLFAPDRVFDPVRFTGELVSFLSRESGLPIPGALTSRLRNQMGIAVSAPRTPSASAAPAEMRAESNMNSRANTTETGSAVSRRTSTEDMQIGNDRAPQTASIDDLAVPQMSSGIHVANAGMVLTWPFLSRAWEMLGLTREGKFVDDVAAQRAAWLLQFAVDERTAVPEYQLTLNKLLCGIPLQAPIVAEIEVTQQERELVEQLLTVMISHWSAIGNTSVQGLRETFLQREGYLSRKEDAWRLQVPKRTFDMLLDRLPWSISTIRLPWMETILWVEWT